MLKRWFGVALAASALGLAPAIALAAETPPRGDAEDRAEAMVALANAQAESAQLYPAGSSSPPAGGGPAPQVKSALDDELPPDVREKLTPEQLHQHLLARQNRQRGIEELVPVVVPVAFFAMLIGIIALALYGNFRRDRLRHETLRNAIAQGAHIPPELITPAKNPIADLRRGVVLLAVGVGLTILIVATTGLAGGAWATGSIPILLGCAYLGLHKLEARRRAVDAPAISVDTYRTPAS